jgi:hypothetical protein
MQEAERTTSVNTCYRGRGTRLVASVLLELMETEQGAVFLARLVHNASRCCHAVHVQSCKHLHRCSPSLLEIVGEKLPLSLGGRRPYAQDVFLASAKVAENAKSALAR